MHVHVASHRTIKIKLAPLTEPAGYAAQQDNSLFFGNCPIRAPRSENKDELS